MNTYFLHQIKRTNGTIEKGIVVKDNFDDVQQSYHAYLGAYAFNKDPNTDYVQCMITDLSGDVVNNLKQIWSKQTKD